MTPRQRYSFAPMVAVASLRARSYRISFLVALSVGISLFLFWRGPAHVEVQDWLKEPPEEPPVQQPSARDSRCIDFPDPGNIAIAVKTGATEAVEKIPVLMRTSLQCAENVMIFSDLEQDVAGYHLYDALANVSESAMEGNPDFDFYKKLKEAEKYGQIEKMMTGSNDPRKPSNMAAWNLDKYKQLHVLENLHAEFPDKDWYIMIDADSYIVWHNLLTWLKQMPNPRRNKLYIGSPTQIDGKLFAHGGSGIFLSQAAMHDFAVVNKGLANKWDKPMKDHCCGDYIIGLALKEMGIDLIHAWPTINGEKPLTLPFGPSHWCQPFITLHHVGSEEMNDLANFELSRDHPKKPLMFSELYSSFVKGILPDKLDNWDNQCGDEKTDVDSYEACQKKCEDDGECFQFNYDGKQCALCHGIHLGYSMPGDGEPGIKSGWLVGRINEWVDKQPVCKAEFLKIKAPKWVG